LILSDADQYSWDDFDWRAVAVDAQISWLPLGDVYGSAKNRFIDGIQCEFIGVDLKCSVDIERRSTAGAMPEETVEVAIYAGSVELSSVSALMPAASTKLRVQALIRAAQLQETASTQFLTIKLANGDAESDVIKIDDEFFAPMLGQRQSAAMIAGISGERLVDDATYHLQKALQVRTIDVVRFDRIEQPGPKPSDFPLWLIGGGQGGGIDQFCPRSIGIAQQGQADLAATKVWLFPLGQNPDYRELCWCFARIALSDRSPSDGAPAFCSEVQDALGFSELLSSLGAKQVGGAIGQADSSFVWRVFNPVDLLVLTRAPQPETGFGFAAIPLLIGELLRLQGVLSANLVQQMVWRDGDLTKYLSGSQHTKFTNVPASESLLNRKKNSDLPPIWSADGSLEQNSSVVSPNVDRDAKFWMWSFLMLTLSVMCAEVVYGVLRYWWKSLALMMLFLFGGIDAKNACAQVQLNLIGYDQSSASVLSLSNEVESRTSIELAQRPIQFERFDQSASEKPMLWVRQLSAIAGPKGRLKPAVETWIKRGGFLVIEGDWTIERLKVLIGGYSAFEGSAQWSVIPPDHELMRSFYLIQALPSCDASVWYGLQYDARLAVVAIPFRFTESLFDQSKDSLCKGAADREQRVRVFVNLMMVVLATDYKRDQIHLPEVLKRLR
jgi:hypothetical protein